MKKIKCITAFVLVLVMLAASVAFAADPTVSIVSPSANNITTSDSLLISVKLNKAATIRVTVYEEKIKIVEVKTSEAAISSAAVSGTALKTAATKSAVSTAAIEPVTYAAVSYKSVDTTSFEAIDFVSNPALETYVDKLYVNSVTYTSTEKIGFYTNQISDVKPGLYKIKVQVLDKDGKVTETVSRLVAVKEKPAEEKVVFEQKQTGAVKVLQNLLKSIFK